MQLKPIDGSNWIECVNLWTEDDKYIASNLYSIAEAQFYPKAVSRALCDGGAMVGYVLYGEDDDREELFVIDRLMIAAKYRRKGYASQAIQELIGIAKANEGYERIISSTEPENSAMRQAFLKNGFRTDGEMDGGEMVYYRQL